MENDTKHWRELAVYEETEWGAGSQVAVALRTAADTVDRLREELETERLRLAACGVAAR